MKVGIPREIKNHEYRVAITPAGVNELVRNGHQVFIERDAGVGSSIPNEDFVAAGAQILDTADDVWADGRPGAQGQGADRRGVPPDARGPDPVHLPAPGRRPATAPTRCSRPAPPRSPTRRCSCPTARCRCWPRCPRWPAGWRRRSARTT